MGRGSIYTPELAESICERIASTGDSLRAACKDAGVPISTFLLWVAEKPELTEQYARAKRSQAEMLAAEIVAIADEEPGTTDTGATDTGRVAHNRLRIDARKWVAAKLLPKVYGDKLAIGGAEDLPPVQTNVTLEPAEAYKRLLGGGSD